MIELRVLREKLILHVRESQMKFSHTDTHAHKEGDMKMRQKLKRRGCKLPTTAINERKGKHNNVNTCDCH